LFFSKLIYLPSRVILDLHSDTSKTQKPELLFTYAQITQGKKNLPANKKDKSSNRKKQKQSRAEPQSKATLRAKAVAAASSSMCVSGAGSSGIKTTTNIISLLAGIMLS